MHANQRTIIAVCAVLGQSVSRPVGHDSVTAVQQKDRGTIGVSATWHRCPCLGDLGCYGFNNTVQAHFDRLRFRGSEPVRGKLAVFPGHIDSDIAPGTQTLN